MLSGLIDTFIFLASFLVVLSFLVYFHELGHYSVARFFNVAVERFSIGFGDVPLDQIFHFKPVWQRMLVVLAGPVFNFILAIAIFAGLGWAFGSYYTESVVGEVQPNTAAEAAGVKVGDKILTMDGKDVSDFNELRRYVVLRSGNAISTIVDRNGREVELTLTPRRVEEKDFIGGKSSAGKIGVGISADAPRVPIEFGPIGALGFGVTEVKDTIAMTGHYIGRIFKGKEDGKQLGSISS